MLPIVNEPAAWSVGLSVGLLLSEPCKKFRSDRDTVCFKLQPTNQSRLGWAQGKPYYTQYSGPLLANTVLCSFVHSTQYSLIVSIKFE